MLSSSCHRYERDSLVLEAVSTLLRPVGGSVPVQGQAAGTVNAMLADAGVMLSCILQLQRAWRVAHALRNATNLYYVWVFQLESVP
jgi:hypothetical protein